MRWFKIMKWKFSNHITTRGKYFLSIFYFLIWISRGETQSKMAVIGDLARGICKQQRDYASSGIIQPGLKEPPPQNSDTPHTPATPEECEKYRLNRACKDTTTCSKIEKLNCKNPSANKKTTVSIGSNLTTIGITQVATTEKSDGISNINHQPSGKDNQTTVTIPNSTAIAALTKPATKPENIITSLPKTIHVTSVTDRQEAVVSTVINPITTRITVPQTTTKPASLTQTTMLANKSSPVYLTTKQGAVAEPTAAATATTAEFARGLINDKALDSVKPTSNSLIGPSKHPYPGLVSIQIKLPGIDKPVHTCAGSIIRKDWVVSAAHCFCGMRKTRSVDIEIVGGVRNVLEEDESEIGRQRVFVKEIICHPEFNKYTYRNSDMAVLRVSPVFLLNEYIQTIQLPADTMRSEGPFLLVGWSQFYQENETFPEQTSTTDLNEISREHYPSSKCASKFIYEPYVDGVLWSHQLCTFDESENYCFTVGDSGGPLYLKAKHGEKFTLIGIVSYGKDNFPTVYTEVAYFMDWIIMRTKYYCLD